MKPHTFCIKTYGCQMNALDSEVMAGILLKRGLVPLDNEEEADLVIFNTCSVRDLAERKVLGTLGRLLKHKRKNCLIGITGCMANSKKEELFSKVPGLDFVLGTNNIHELNSLLDALETDRTHQVRIDSQFSHELDYTDAARQDPVKAYVSIIRGCNKYCTYCVVPYTRGPEVSRPPSDILDECKRLLDAGYRDITLLGQNVNSYGKDHAEWHTLFHDLLEKLDTIAQNRCWVRFMTSHPVDISVELMEACRDLSSVANFVHFPLQAGSDRILKKMNRRYTLQQYMDKVNLFREMVPTISLGTDIIVGFPSETDDEFEATRTAMEKIRFSQAFLFSYSPRKGTPAFRFVDDVSKEQKNQRLYTLQALQERVYQEERVSCIGKIVQVLVEKPSRKGETMLKGHTKDFKGVVFPGSEQFVGTFQKVKIENCVNQTLVGTMTQ